MAIEYLWAEADNEPQEASDRDEEDDSTSD
jgi:hypothetical protein